MSKFAYYAASYYPRYGDPIGTFVAVCTCDTVGDCAVGRELETIAAQAAEGERKESALYHDGEIVDDIVAGMAFTYSAKDLFTAAELREHRRALLAGKVVWLSR